MAIRIRRALIAAELKQSRAGISAVAGAFAAIGEHKAASMALARIRTHWPEDESPVRGQAPMDWLNRGPAGCYCRSLDFIADPG